MATETSIIAKNPFDEPGKPENVRATDWDKDHVDLAWTPPTNDGGSPVTAYIVEKKDKFGQWEKALEVPADQCKATVPDLIENQVYEFRVRAVNKGGEGEPSDATPPITAKPRNQAPRYIVTIIFINILINSDTYILHILKDRSECICIFI